MKLEVLLKTIDPATFQEISKEEKEEKRLRQLLNKDEEDDEDTFLSKMLKFTYKPYVIDLRDVVAHGEEDNEHTKLITSYGVFYAKIPYNVFSTIYAASLSLSIKTINDFAIH